MLLIGGIRRIRKAHKNRQAKKDAEQNQTGQPYSHQGSAQNGQGHQASYQGDAGESYSNQVSDQYERGQ
jgi:hypothetical protein